MIDRFLSFMEKIDKSQKTAIKMLKKEAIRSTTGANLRGIMLLAGESSIVKVTRDSVRNIEYYKVKDEDLWKIHIASEAYEVSQGISEIEMFDQPEMTAVLHHICVS